MTKFNDTNKNYKDDGNEADEDCARTMTTTMTTTIEPTAMMVATTTATTVRKQTQKQSKQSKQKQQQQQRQNNYQNHRQQRQVCVLVLLIIALCQLSWSNIIEYMFHATQEDRQPKTVEVLVRQNQTIQSKIKNDGVDMKVMNKNDTTNRHNTTKTTKTLSTSSSSSLSTKRNSNQTVVEMKSSSHLPQQVKNTQTKLAQDDDDEEEEEDTCKPRREPIVKWHHYSEQHTTTNKAAKKRLLIGLYSGFGKYTKLFELTTKANLAYARLWGHDVVQIQGSTLIFDDECEPPAYRASYNKLTLLQTGINLKEHFDQILILDSDALIYDMDIDITRLLPRHHILAAHKVREPDVSHTWDINNGVTLWDLHHRYIKKLTNQWNYHSRDGIMKDHHPRDDQYHLQWVLRHGNYSSIVQGLGHGEFEYGAGTVIKHFIRRKGHKDWNDADVLADRVDSIARTVHEICEERFQPVCDGIEVTIPPDAYME